MKTFILWGIHPLYGPEPIKITGGLFRHCFAEARWRSAHGFRKLIIRPKL